MLLDMRLVAITILIAVSMAFISTGTVAAAEDAAAKSDEVGDIQFNSKILSMKKAGVGEVTFPHSTHALFNSCDECHPDIFIDKIGSNDVSMQRNMDGEYCGTCHDSVSAFPLYFCAKCHVDLTKNK
jgi:c(7)-type cytochrome triheme protein